MRQRWLIMAGLLSLALTAHAQEHWPEYRGPNADGHSTARGLPLTWSDTRNVKWKTPIPGRGWSTPVIWGEQIWLTTATPDGREMFVLCVHRDTGKILLNRRLFTNAEPDPIHDLNSYASPSPVIEPGRVYVHFGNYGTACLDTRTFRVIWERRDLQCRFSVGPGSSPILYRDRLILTMDGIDRQSVIALDKRTGRTVWQQTRSVIREKSRNGETSERHKAFHTPVLARVNGRVLLISPAAQGAYAYDPDTGEEVWRVQHDGYSGSSRTLLYGDLALINTGFDWGNLLAVRMDGRGDVTRSHVVWKVSRAVPFKVSPLLIDGLVYLLNDNGILTCLDAKTGAEVWKERLGGQYSASLLYADGRIYCCSEDGRIRVIRPGRRFELLAENVMPEGCMASPVAVGRALYLRTKTHLYRIEQ
ncbi:MAG: PQQ-binding-like beta-propeller repeat protein [Chloroherpetonaceae bacterium]|nr:PQQ-binding-like beta-propeller repeat protein [Chthonomonadaceae bacterium]MDW8207571.1 PQQ-binding-like beta-propeller repeat protein [Chloroherpetonaceae bacterium]